MKPMCPAYHVPWPFPNFLIDPPDIFTDDADPENGYPDEEEEDGKEGEYTFHLGADYKAPDEEETAKVREKRAVMIPKKANICRGTTEKPVIRSKLSLTSL